ncbi:hypothetical protein Rsub_12114 [Raphidocelis subcapitata]|uniref:Uncharacterized protein n=1 Tax=Raphidocelis subcapitata TaxID=307507 RepID=A0A2V0PNX8_9CHLO|nr:hypothetical protein Rsub_12114 [Raphidocelis subcapitata]|eukprot:GBF99147.1 hypothetical protein Rsub_12114 [Raphidocelis subcapitata]
MRRHGSGPRPAGVPSPWGSGGGGSSARPSTSGAAGGGSAPGGPGAPPSPPRPLQLNPLTLSFEEPALEAAYVKHAGESQLAFDAGSHGWHVAIALLHTGYSARAATGALLSREALSLTLPYLAAALCHWWLSRTPAYARHRLGLLLCFEAAYCVICVFSMPHWVLYSSADTWKACLKDFVLGSGVFISVWCTVFCLKPLFWVHYITVPLEFAFQTVMLTQPVCAALTATPYGRETSLSAARLLDGVAAAGALAAPACPARGGGAAGAAGTADAAASCASIMVAWQLLCCGALLYGKYRLERAARVKFAAAGGWGAVHDAWPAAPRGVRVLVHAAVALQVGIALWAWLGCAPVVAPVAAAAGAIGAFGGVSGGAAAEQRLGHG